VSNEGCEEATHGAKEEAMRRLQGTILAVVALALVTAACSSNNSPPSKSTTAATSSPATSGGGASGTTIVAQNFAFDPSSVNVSSGSVTLTVTNKDSAEHTFTLDDDSSDTDLPPGKTVTIKLDLTKTVGWHCKIHPSMTGTLNVG
jgi:plastocyanin